jgi:hypothetical protein
MHLYIRHTRESAAHDQWRASWTTYREHAVYVGQARALLLGDAPVRNHLASVPTRG